MKTKTLATLLAVALILSLMLVAALPGLAQGDPTEEPVAEVTEEPVEDPAPVVTEEPVQEPAPEVTEEPTEEPAPVVTEEPVQDPAPEVTEEPMEEPAPVVTEEPVEEPVSESAPPLAPVILAAPPSEKNPTCADLGYPYELKFDPPNPVTNYPIGTGTVSWWYTTNYYEVAWSSTFGIDAVIMKGGSSDANVYTYNPEAFGGSGLVTGLNPSGLPAALSHITFCYDYEVEVTKNANTRFTRTYTWDITKTVSPATWNMFVGDSGTSDYLVNVNRYETDSDFAVSGQIWIHNPDPTYTASITSVVDDAGGVPGTVSCPANTVAPGANLTCTYDTGPQATNVFGGTNTATVTTTGWVGGGSGTAAIDFGAATITEVGYSSVTVTDTNGMSWTATNDASWTYSITFLCNVNGTLGNVATIVETGQSASASVTVNCYNLTVTKDAATALDRTYHWTIDKSADQSALTLSLGQVFLVNYTVVIGETTTDSNWTAGGGIAVHNPAPIGAVINGVSDLVAPDISATVTCGVNFPYTLAAGGTLNCTYAAALPDAADRLNTATATLQNYAYASNGTGTPTGTTSFDGTANVSFSGATVTEIDECIAVSDSLFGNLGELCNGGGTFSYSMDIGPYDVCGLYEVANVASYVTNDTGATDSATWTVNVDVPCLGGCTLTPGYWKTHSVYGPAHWPDDTWDLVGGPDAPFYLSGQSWYEVLWTPPTRGNVYYILGHAFIAARLNVLNGAATTPEVDAALAYAEAFFSTYTPDVKFSRTVKTEATVYATLLDNYNNGYIGPGHCSE